MNLKIWSVLDEGMVSDLVSGVLYLNPVEDE